MDGLKLVATGGYIPSKKVTNDMLSEIVDTNDEWIRTRTGIESRNYCNDSEDGLFMAVSAAKEAIEKSGIDKSKIGCLICATVSAELITPSLACLVQGELGLREDIPILDVNAACTGFMYGVEVARGFLLTTRGEYALVIGCEVLSRLMDMTDRNTCILFADGAGAGLFRLTESQVYSSTLGGRGNRAITVPGSGIGNDYIRMDGKEVFKFAVETIPKCIKDVLSKSNLTIDDIDRVICHQANERIIDHCSKKMKAEPNLFYKNISHMGNTSAASIPLALNELERNGQLHTNDKLLCVGFGGGLTWAGLILEYDGEKR